MIRQIQILWKEKACSSAPWERPGRRGQAVPGGDSEVFEGGWEMSPWEMSADCNTPWVRRGLGGTHH